MRIQVGNTPPKRFPRRSVRFVCSMCGEWLVEWIPVIKIGMKTQFEREKFPRVILKCPNGHEGNPRWRPIDPRVRMRS